MRSPFIPEPSLHSMANKFGDFRCPEEAKTLTLVKTLFFAGTFAGIAFLALFGGRLSKVTLMKISCSCTILGMILVLTSSSLLMGSIGFFFCLFCGLINAQISYSYSIEIMSPLYRQTIFMAISISFCLGYFLNTLSFYVLRDFQKVLLCCYGPLILIVFFSFLFFIKASPIWMISKLSPEESLSQLAFIAKINQRESFDISVQEI